MEFGLDYLSLAGAVQRQLRGRLSDLQRAGGIYTDVAMMAGVATCEERVGTRFEASVLEPTSAAATSARCSRCW